MAPPPIPVPIVRYTKSESPCAAPHRASPKAAAFTSVSNPTGKLRALRTVPTKSKFRQPAFGVEVMNPKLEEPARKSTGPNEPMPTAFNLPAEFSCRNLTAAATVHSGDVVGISTVFRSSGPLPIPQMNFVPPASIAPNMFIDPQGVCHRKRELQNLSPCFVD